jgi:glucosyl-dolichyl phosphate glucuronosyltransferase
MAFGAMKITVIVPSFGRPKSVQDTIRSLLSAVVQSELVQILVVDNNSDPEIASCVRTYCDRVGPPLTYLREPSPGVAAARHRGAREARGDILAFVDDDVEVSEGWLQAISNAFDDKRVGIVGGPSLPRFLSSVPGWFWEFLRPTPYGGWSCSWLSLLDIGRSVYDINPDWVWSLNLSIRRDLFVRLGGQHPCYVPRSLQRWQGDGETGLARKIKASDVSASYIHGALVYHLISADRLTPEYFAHRAFYQGVCDSFSRIRASSAPWRPEPDSFTVPDFTTDLSRWSAQADSIKSRILTAYSDGWRFHQQEAAADPQLQEWIRRAHYWTADIRDELEARSLQRPQFS